MALRIFLKSLIGHVYLKTVGKKHLSQSVTILMMHRVLANEEQADFAHRRSLCIGQHSFESLLIYLQHQFECIPLNQLFTALAPASKPRLVMTFDDGWSDNFYHAYPLLKKYQMPASIFLSTDLIDSPKKFWWEAIGEYLWQADDALKKSLFAKKLQQLNHPIPTCIFLNPALSQERSLRLQVFLHRLKNLSPQNLESIVQLIPPSQTHDTLTWEQVREMEASGLITFGPHGAAHHILTSLTPEELVADIERSKAALALHCQSPLKVYCYPNGNYNQAVVDAVTSAGYRAALTTEPGLVANNRSPFNLPRIDVGQYTAKHRGLLGWRLLQGVKV